MKVEDIIKALKCCIGEKCSECPLNSTACSEKIVMAFAVTALKSGCGQSRSDYVKKSEAAEVISEACGTPLEELVDLFGKLGARRDSSLRSE